MLGLLIVCFIL